MLKHALLLTKVYVHSLPLQAQGRGKGDPCANELLFEDFYITVVCTSDLGATQSTQFENFIISRKRFVLPEAAAMLD